MKTSCWHFTKNDCCFWGLYKNNRSVLIKSKTEAFFLSLNVASFFCFLWYKYVCLWQTKKKHEYYFAERKNVLWDCVLVEKRYNTSAENNVLREGVWSKKDIILRRKKNVFWDLCLVEKDIILRRQKILCFGRKKIWYFAEKKVFWDCKKKIWCFAGKKVLRCFTVAFCQTNCLLPLKCFFSCLLCLLLHCFVSF